MSWSVADMPDQSGRVALVTGANSGIGFEVAKGLAQAGAHVVLGCRRRAAAEEAADRIAAAHGGATLSMVDVDLADLASVRKAADDVLAGHDRLDLLVNNAGVMAVPLQRTADGFESQLGVNHLGHFALTGLLLDRLLGTEGSRVVTVTSIMHRRGTIDFDDLNAERSYDKWRAYGQAKLANLLFAKELGRRLESAGVATVSAAAHPGYSATNLQATGPRQSGQRLIEMGSRIANLVVAQSAARGALPILYAATSPGVASGDYYGPGGPFELWGGPAPARPAPAADDHDIARRLWDTSEQLTGVRFGPLAP